MDGTKTLEELTQEVLESYKQENEELKQKLAEKTVKVEQLEKANELTPEEFKKMGYQSRLKLATLAERNEYMNKLQKQDREVVFLVDDINY